MGRALCPERSPSAPIKVKPYLNLFETLSDANDSIVESSASEFSDGELLTTEEAQLLWDNESLSLFSQVCLSVPDDNEFNRLNNKLLSALKLFSSSNKIYCIKCKKMTQMTKRGKTNKTYQFACGTHTLSATQILGSLPDFFILKQIPEEPRHILNETLSWLGKDHLSPELNERQAKRNAIKRYSAHRSPLKAPMTSLLTSRNTINELLVEIRDLKVRVSANESAMNLLKESNFKLSALNSELTEQIKLLREENSILKKYLYESQSPSSSLKKIINDESENCSNLSFAKVTDMVKPMNKAMKFYTKASSKELTPKDVISPSVSIQFPNSVKAEFSPLKMVFFKGCHRKSIGDYKRILPKIGFEPHWARHICFLAEDIIQVTTFESKVEALIRAFESISTTVVHLPFFDPFAGISYADYGIFSDESAGKSYISLMKKCALKLTSDSQRTPSLRRIAAFISKTVELKNIHVQPAARKTRVFCLGDFIIKKEQCSPTNMDTDTVPPVPTGDFLTVESSNTESWTHEQTTTDLTETETDELMRDTSSSVNDQ